MTKAASKSLSKSPAVKTEKSFQAAGKRYWKNPMYFRNLGTFEGLVTEKQEILFRASSPKSDILKWTTEEDERKKKRAALRAKRRKELGLEDKS